MTSATNAWGMSIFCDDIRQEVAGKLSLIGVYGPDMVMAGAFPMVYPKLCIFVSYYEIVDSSTADLSLKISVKTKDNEMVINETQLPRKDVMANRLPIDQALGDTESGRVNIFRLPIIFSPFHIPGECLLKVRMHCDDVITKLGVLWIRAISPTDNVQLS